MEFKVGQNCSRKKSDVVWKIAEVDEETVRLEKPSKKENADALTKTMSIKLFSKRWIVTD